MLAQIKILMEQAWHLTHIRDGIFVPQKKVVSYPLGSPSKCYATMALAMPPKHGAMDAELALNISHSSNFKKSYIDPFIELDLSVASL